ncbi:MAG TPA: heme o synthase [Dehalococcoidia bacterium]|nr:heme o synthase [Dehalococcoidia bacterium]
MLGSLAVQTARDVRSTALAYFRLTKPRIVVLLLITTVPAMILAKGGMPSPWLILATLLGGAVAAGGANAMNCYFDRDIDGMMLRTRGRPLPAGQIEPEKAVVFGIVLGGLGFLVLEAFVNLAAALLTLAAFAFYVLVYTLVLKRSTPLNIVIGGAAGAMPPLVGWAAVTGEVGAPALVLFGIVVLWTPPHFWALALNYSRDYERAGVPMLPVVVGPEETKRHILLHAVALVAVSLLLPLSGVTGAIYLTAALVLGGLFIGYALRLWWDQSARASAALFRYSIVYLGLLFAAVAVDGLVGK